MVLRESVYHALDVLAAIEERAEVSDDYHATKRIFADKVALASNVLKQFAVSIQPATLAEMQDEFYNFTSADRFKCSAIANVAVRSYLTSAWHEIGPWRK